MLERGEEREVLVTYESGRLKGPGVSLRPGRPAAPDLRVSPVQACPDGTAYGTAGATGSGHSLTSGRVMNRNLQIRYCI